MSVVEAEVRELQSAAVETSIDTSARQLTGRFSISIRERRVLLACLDLMAGGFASWWAYELLRPAAMPNIPAFAPVLFGLAWVAGLFLVDGYAFQIPTNRIQSAIAVVKATLFAGLAGVVAFFIEPYVMTRPLIILSTALGVVLLLLTRLTVARLLLHESLAVRAILIGRSNPSAEILRTLNAARFECRVVAQLIGDFHDESHKDGMLAELRRLVEFHSLHEVIVVNNSLRFVPGLAEQCLIQGVRVVPASALVERYMGRVPLNDIDSHWYLGLPDNDLWERPYSVARRFIDLAVASIISIPFLLILPLLALIIRIESPGPVFLKQRRVGRHGLEFDLLKLRTMRLDAETAGAQFTSADDPRITRIGRILRMTHLDELPQVLNIVRGDMSLIGPRPERPELMSLLESEIPRFRTRLLVKPGLTGWAQVKGGYASTIPDFVKKLEYDAYYIKNRSLRLDMQILSSTFVSVIGLRGR